MKKKHNYNTFYTASEAESDVNIKYKKHINLHYAAIQQHVEHAYMDHTNEKYFQFILWIKLLQN